MSTTTSRSNNNTITKIHQADFINTSSSNGQLDCADDQANLLLPGGSAIIHPKILTNDSEMGRIDDIEKKKNQTLTQNPEGPQKKKGFFIFSFPIAVQFILFNELTERFAYYGNRAILTLFLKSIDFDTTKAVIVFSLQSALSCTMPLIGGHIADAWFGRYWTIVIFSFMYFIGAMLLAFAANPDFIDSKADPIYVYIALILTALGTGGIKPCVSTFGAEQIMPIGSKQLENDGNSDQNNTTTTTIANNSSSGLVDASSSGSNPLYNDDHSFGHHGNSLLVDDNSTNYNLPYSNPTNDNGIAPINSNQDVQPVTNDNDETGKNSHQNTNDDDDDGALSSESFFISFYFMMNVGSILATLFIPIIRTRVSYFWAFILPAIFMLISIIILIIGRALSMFKLTAPDGGILGKVFRLLWRSCKRRKWTKRVFVIPVPVAAEQQQQQQQQRNQNQDETGLFHIDLPDELNSDGNQSQSSQNNNTNEKTKVVNMLVGVHDFVRFVHLNYDYVMHRLYNPTFNVDDSTIQTNSNNGSNNNSDDHTTQGFSYDTPDWLVPTYTCPFDPTPDLSTKSPSSSPTQSQQKSQPRTKSTQLYINYGTCQCSVGCTCGCGCNNTEPTLTTTATNHTRVENSQNLVSAQNFTRTIESPDTSSLVSSPRFSPCQCTAPKSPQEIQNESKITLLHFHNASQFLHPNNSIRDEHTPPSPGAFDAIYSDNREYVPYYPRENFSESPLQSLSSQYPYRRERTLCCLPKFTHLSQIFPGMDVSSDEYTVLDYIDKHSFAFKNSKTPLSIDELLLPTYLPQPASSGQTIVPPETITGSQYNDTQTMDKQQSTESLSLKQAIISGQFIQALRVVLVIIPVLLTLPVFWSLMNQQGSTWMVQAEEMDLNVYIFNLDKKGVKIEPEQLSILNPIFLFVMLPILDYLTRAIKSDAKGEGKEQNREGRNGYSQQVDQDDNQFSSSSGVQQQQGSISTSPTNLSTQLVSTQLVSTHQKQLEGSPQQQTISPTSLASPLTKMIIGMAFAAISYLCAAGVDWYIRHAAQTIDPVTQLPSKISILWQIPQYFWITMAEVCISVTGLYFVFDMSPSNMKSLVTALYLFSGALGDFLTGLFYALFERWGFSRLQMFLGFAVSIVVNSLGIVVIQHVFGKLYKFK